MSVRPLSRVELMLWVRGVTIKWYQSLGYDFVDIQGRIVEDSYLNVMIMALVFMLLVLVFLLKLIMNCLI
jgi:uncharacterized protein HemY